MATKKKSVETGEAVNNVEIKDMQPKVKDESMDDFLQKQREFDKLVNSNEVRLSAKIRNKEIIKGKEIINKQTGMPVVDELGEVRHYSDTYIVTLLFQGGSLDYRCNQEMYQALDLNSTYLFKGYMGVVKEYGKDVVSPIFQSYQLVL